MLAVKTERRRFIRVDAKIIIKIEELNNQVYANKAVSKNISRGGLLFEYYKPYSLATVLSIEIRLPEISRRIECYGKVVRVEEIMPNKLFDIGIAFINISDNDLADIDKFIEITMKEN